ncbi:MAG: hypothetical protein DHS20C14_09660 [Phycisphaeraceae bacterium]|nr:MAG: hypothetical protein DHS20C14_09660 [Phycisphaeraceae bacterium]
MTTRITRPRAITGVAFALLAVVAAAGVGMAHASQPATKPAAAPPTDLPSAEAIFERHVEAIGGWDAVRSHRNRRVTGTFDGPPFTGAARLKIWADAPDKLHIEIREPLGVKLGVFYTGEYGWEEFNGGEPVPIFGPRLVEFIEGADFYGESSYKDRYSEIETVGAGEFSGRPVWAVRAVSTSGRARRLFFEQDSGLFVGEHTTIARMSEDGKLEAKFVEVLHENYTEIEGVLVPTRQTQKVDGDARPIIFNYTSIRVNVSDEHSYYPPEPQRAKLEADIKRLKDQAAAAKAERERANSGG